MLRVCSWCSGSMGEKPPFEDKTVTHGMCDKCLERVGQDIERRKDEKEQEKSK